MIFEKHIGIIGGMSAIGLLIVEHILPLLSGNKVLIAGRRPINRSELIEAYEDKLEYSQMDYRNEPLLDLYCSQCSLIINAAGPSYKIGDRIAIQALKNDCHYIDIGGYDALFHLMRKHEKEMIEKKLCFIIGAGWMPGISGVFSKYIFKKHVNDLEDIRLRVYFGAVDEWSYNSTYDLTVSSMKSVKPSIYSYGKEISVKQSEYIHQKLFNLIGRKKICLPLFDGQLIEIAKSLNQVKEVSTFVMVNDFISMLTFMYLNAFKKNKPEEATLILQKDYRRLVKKEKCWGSVICKISGLKEQKYIEKYFYLYTNNNLLFTALTPVVVCNKILKNQTKIGLNYPCNSIDCDLFMEELNSYGIKHSQYEKNN